MWADWYGMPLPRIFLINFWSLEVRIFGAFSGPSVCLLERCHASRSRPPVRLKFQSKALEFL